MFPLSFSGGCFFKPHDTVFDELLITSSYFYELCYVFVEYITLHILKCKVCDLNRLDIKQNFGPGFE